MNCAFLLEKNARKKTREGQNEYLVNVENGLSHDALEVNLHSERKLIEKRNESLHQPFCSVVFDNSEYCNVRISRRHCGTGVRRNQFFFAFLLQIVCHTCHHNTITHSERDAKTRYAGMYTHRSCRHTLQWFHIDNNFFFVSCSTIVVSSPQ